MFQSEKDDENIGDLNPGLNRSNIITVNVGLNAGPSSLLNETTMSPGSSVKQEPAREPVPYFQPHQTRTRVLNAIINVPQDDPNGDCVIDETSIGKRGMPMPLPSTSDGLLKQENEVVSGDMYFIRTVSKI